jgi:dTDP-4-dehydrorhamnose 3,5-epimerase-like enzyme
MAHLINLNTFTDSRGNLTVIDNSISFEIKRIYYIYNANGQRGGHRHKKNKQALICISGSCELFVNDGINKNTFVLDKPDLCLFLDNIDWHTMYNFSENAILLVLASEHYDIEDYIDEEYNN